MDLVNQYLRAVAALLPRAQREDITTELRDIILSRIEARETALGRPLTNDEIEEELRAMGHPILVAARYRDEPQHLVGPSLYPYWMFGMKIAIAIQVAAALVTLIVRTLSGQDFGYALGQAIGQGVAGSITLIGVATIAAWLIEQRKIHVSYLDNWRVRDLHVLEYTGWGFTDLCDHFRQGHAAHVAATQAAARGDATRETMMRQPERDAWSHFYRKSPIGRGISLVAFGTVFILWWAGVIHIAVFDQATDLRRLGIDLGGMNLGDLHRMLFWPVLAYSAAVIAQGALILIYPSAIWLRGLIAVLMGAALLMFCIWIWTASPIASAIRVHSLAELALKLKLEFQNRPFMLAPLLTLWLGLAAFGAVVQIVQGLWEMLILSWRRY
jgi:hypothetical protein